MKYERIKFLVIALKNSVEVYAWAPKPYHKFMAFKVTGPRPSVLSSAVPLRLSSLSIPSLLHSPLPTSLTALCWWT